MSDGIVFIFLLTFGLCAGCIFISVTAAILMILEKKVNQWIEKK